MVYEVEFENTLKNMRDNTGFFKIRENPPPGWVLNNYPNKMLSGTEVKINDNNINITLGIQKVLVDSKYKTAKSMNNMDKVVLEICYKKLNIIIVFQQKGVCQVVINIFEIILIMMYEEF